MPRCLIFNPYFEVLGGGERYTVALGKVIAKTHDVTFAAPVSPNPALAERLGFGVLDVIPLAEADFSRASAEFDLAIVVTVYVPPPSYAGHSVLVVQFPRQRREHDATTRRERAALRRYHHVVYSKFVHDWLQRRWGVRGDVLMPPVGLAGPPVAPKENLILSVGRFVFGETVAWNSKRHDVLIDAFSKLPEPLRASWRLVLAGGFLSSPETDAHLDALKAQASGLNIAFETNVTPERLTELQDRARLYWHASGFGRPEAAPDESEHFGISTVEAMSHGAVPLVYADGGQLEVVDPRFGRLWTSVPELVQQTSDLMQVSTEDLDRLAQAAREASVAFGKERFDAEVGALLDRIGALNWSTSFAGRALRRVNRNRRRLLARLYERRTSREDRTTMMGSYESGFVA